MDGLHRDKEYTTTVNQISLLRIQCVLYSLAEVLFQIVSIYLFQCLCPLHSQTPPEATFPERRIQTLFRFRLWFDAGDALRWDWLSPVPAPLTLHYTLEP